MTARYSGGRYVIHSYSSVLVLPCEGKVEIVDVAPRSGALSRSVPEALWMHGLDWGNRKIEDEAKDGRRFRR